MATLKYPEFKGEAKQLEDQDLPRIAHDIGAGEDEVHMLMEVESAGYGFDLEGRPKMLFEPHIFYDELDDPKERAAAVKAGLAYPKWKKGYPKDSYPRLLAAMKINETAALKSASWGASQVLGRNYKMVGFDTVQDMVNAMCEDEDNHIEAMIAFVKSAGIDDDMRRLAALKRPTTPDDCRPIALAYNGARYADNSYHIKMATAHNKWKKIPNTVWTPDSQTGPIITPPAPGETLEQEGLSVADVRAVQQLLKDKGYTEVGKIDGDIGKNTISAVTAFQIAQGLPVTGKVDRALWEQLKAAPMRPVSVERANATVATLEEQKVPAVTESRLLSRIGTGVTALSGVGLILDGDISGLDRMFTAVNKMQAIGQALGDMLPWAVGLGGGGAALYLGSKILSKQVEGFRKGTVR